MSLPILPAERAQYSTLIDAMFEGADLEKITAKQVRRTLAAQLGKDISGQKEALQALIIERFDLATKGLNFGSNVQEISFSEQRSPNQTVHAAKSNKRRKSNTQTSDISVTDKNDITPANQKRKKVENSSVSKEFDDEKYAKILQAEENRGTRATRGMSNGKKTKKSISKKVSAAKRSSNKIRVSDDSGLEDVGTDIDGKEKEAKKKGGFHKLYQLSEPLSALLGESTLSRPQVVKNIWAYIKARELQDPNDKRQIICDERMQLVFKQDRVHMFTMNKIIGNQLYDIEDE